MNSQLMLYQKNLIQMVVIEKNNNNCVSYFRKQSNLDTVIQSVIYKYNLSNSS